MSPKKQPASKKTRRRQKELVISTERQWEAISSPTRAAIIECLTAIGPASAKEIAAELGRSAELIHHHIPILLETGFVVEVESRQLQKHTERVFDDCQAKWVFDTETDPKIFVEGSIKMGRAWSRANERLLEKAFREHDPNKLSELMKKTTFRSESAHLRPSALKEVRQHLEAIKEIFQRERCDDTGEHQTIYWSLIPIKDGK